MQPLLVVALLSAIRLLAVLLPVSVGPPAYRRLAGWRRGGGTTLATPEERY